MKLLLKTTGDCCMELPLPPPLFFLLSVYIFIFNKISLIFHLLFLYLTCSCPYLQNNIMVTAAPMYQRSLLLSIIRKRGRDKFHNRLCYRQIYILRVFLYRNPPFFSSPDPKGHVNYCQHLAFVVVVVRHKLFQKSSLKVLHQWKPNLVRIITRVSSFKTVSGDAVHQPTWPLLFKIEHMVKLQVLGNNSKTVNNIKNLTWGKNDQHSKIYLPCNLEINLIIHLGVIALFSSNL